LKESFTAKDGLEEQEYTVPAPTVEAFGWFKVAIGNTTTSSNSKTASTVIQTIQSSRASGCTFALIVVAIHPWLT
jgi:hypothetical protein